MSTSKFVWTEDNRAAKAAFTISQVGQLNFEVEAGIHGRKE